MLHLCFPKYLRFIHTPKRNRCYNQIDIICISSEAFILKRFVIKALSVLCAALLLLTCLISCSEKAQYALECKGSDGKTSAGIDSKLYSLLYAVVNYQLGADSLESDMWDLQYQEGNTTTVREIVVAQTKAYAKGLLQAEYLCDVTYKIGLSDEQRDSVDKYVSEIISSYGSQKSLESYLSTFGADTEALRRYMELVLKQNTLYESFYSEGGIRYDIVNAQKPSYFGEHFAVADHILVKYSGGLKDDGTEIPISDEEKEAKRQAAKSLYNEISNGVRDFDSALEAYNDDTYKFGYPFGYFVPDSFYWTGISTDVQDAVNEMNVGEIRFIDTEDGAYIVRKNAMDENLYRSNGNFETYIESTLAQEDFLKICEESALISENADVISKFDPALIPSFSIDALGS